MARKRNTKEDLQRFVIYTIVPLFALHSLSTIAIFFLVGSGHLRLPNSLLMSLLTSTFSEAAAVFVIISKYLFTDNTIVLPATQIESRPHHHAQEVHQHTHVTTNSAPVPTHTRIVSPKLRQC
jgi:hypothetical protein